MATNDQPVETTDVLICGCGPTGALLAGYLARARIHSIALERERDIPTDPRGVALDEDGIRLLQGLGIYDKIFTEIGMCLGSFGFVPGTEKRLDVEPFMTLDYRTTEGGTGHPGFIGQKQPLIEKYLRQVIAEGGYGSVRVGSTVMSVEEDDNWVYVTYKDQSETVHRVRAKFMVGCDGKTGYTRKKYLEPKGIIMEKTSQTDYEEDWVAMNWKMTVPTPETHPNFPLWQLGYSPEQVYDSFFPENFRFLCNPERPAVCGRFGRPADRLLRFEYVVQNGEDPNEMATPEKMKECVFPYFTHKGSRYGLQEDVAFPEDCIQTLRCRPFHFSARSCNKWALGRVVLCGDAAHVFPPFGGQGIASGFRDASALAWRLAVACRPNYSGNYQALLRGWYAERKQQLERSLAATVENGKNVNERNPVRLFVRTWYLWLVQLVPSWKRWLEMGPRRDGMTRYEYAPGMAFLPLQGGGLCFPQVYCVALQDQDSESKKRVFFTDDIIFAPGKSHLFQLVVLLDLTSEVQEAQAAIAGISDLCNGEVSEQEATYIVHNITARSPVTRVQNVVRIATGDEFGEEHCSGPDPRPWPKYYDPYRIRKDVNGATYILLRPDRFIFAACNSIGDLRHAVSQVSSVLQANEV